MGLMKGRWRTKVKHSWVTKTQKHAGHHRKHPVRVAPTGRRGVELRVVTQVRRSVHADASRPLTSCFIKAHALGPAS